MGDARNNRGNSLVVGAAKMGMDFRAVAPGSLQPDPELVEQATAIAGRTGARRTITDDLDAMVNDCDFLYTGIGSNRRSKKPGAHDQGGQGGPIR
jgi:ornithine carbamoyltransferase